MSTSLVHTDCGCNKSCESRVFTCSSLTSERERARAKPREDEQEEEEEEEEEGDEEDG